MALRICSYWIRNCIRNIVISAREVYLKYNGPHKHPKSITKRIKKNSTNFAYLIIDNICELGWPLKRIPKLPPEILIQIFEYLPLAQKRSLRLVCQDWNAIICNRTTFLDEEIFRVESFNSTHKINRMLRKSRRDTFNLMFREIVLTDEDLPIWPKIGTKVRSLCIDNCTVHSSVLFNILFYCENLNSLTIRFMSRYSHDRLESLIKHIMSERLKLERVSRVELGIDNQRWLDQTFIQQLFYIFPKMTFLKIVSKLPALPAVRDDPKTPAAFFGVRREICALMDDRISCEVYCDTEPLSFVMVPWSEGFDSDITLAKCKSFSINIPSAEKRYFIEQLMRKLKQVERLNIAMDNWETPMTVVLKRLLCHFCHLNHLSLQRVMLTLTTDVFKTLLSSQLSSLHLRDALIRLRCDFYTQEPFQYNTTLKTLSMTHPRLQSIAVFPFVRYFRGLEYLELENTADDVLDRICKYQTKLKTLILHKPTGTDIGFTGRKHKHDKIYPISRLRNLEYLFLYTRYEARLTERAFAEFNFPKLRHLFLYVSNPTSIVKGVFAGIEKCRNIEILTIRYERVWSFVDWSNLCAKLASLRQLFIYTSTNVKNVEFTDEQYKQLFALCPSLEHLYRGSPFSSLTYERDKQSREVYKIMTE